MISITSARLAERRNKSSAIGFFQSHCSYFRLRLNLKPIHPVKVSKSLKNCSRIKDRFIDTRIIYDTVEMAHKHKNYELLYMLDGSFNLFMEGTHSGGTWK